jgi:alpha-beta hydrolase superfamily lysophospholipase
MFTSSCE